MKPESNRRRPGPAWHPVGRITLRTHPIWAILEAGLLSELLLVGLFSLSSSSATSAVAPNLLSQGTLFIGGGTALWCALRMRPAESRRWPIRLIRETLAALGLSLVLTLGWWLGIRLLDWQEALAGTVFAGAGGILFSLATGAAFFACRVALDLWLFWNRLRRRHLHWALTHMQVQLVLLFALLALGAILLALAVEGYLPWQGGKGGGVVAVVDRVVLTLLPAIGVLTAMTLAGLAFVLPPTALFAYLVARRTTRRLDALAETATVLREGDYSARVQVQGEDEVAQLQADFNAMAGELEHTVRDLQLERDKVATLLQSQRELVASVSHELRTPVATMRGYLESAQVKWGEGLPDALRHDLEIVENEAVRLQGLIDDLFTLSRAEAGGLPLDIRPVDVTAVIRRQVEAIAPLAWQSSRVEVTTEIPPDLPPALADGGRLEQILANLLRNGVQHTLPGGIVVAAASAREREICMEVRDTGEGIAEEDLSHIWDRFYRGERADQGKRSGAGLGLALVKELTEAMGGTVQVESTPGQGTCFAVRLPRA
jgi:signal transduction histidine kinase